MVIAGPCTLESLDLGMRIGEELAGVCDRLGLPLIFKASFDKANRTSAGSPRGPGAARGLEWLATIRDRLCVAVTTDIHTPEQAGEAAEVVSLLQIPAFLCRQSDLLDAAARASDGGRIGVNVKKGQFLSPAEMRGPVGKLGEGGCSNVLLTERGTFFGYHALVNDFAGLGDLMELDAPGGAPPVCFDVTHSTQRPGIGAQSGGRPERAPLLARASVAAGVHAVFIECHPEPESAHSDAATQLPLGDMGGLLASLKEIRSAMMRT